MRLTKFKHACFTVEKDGQILVVDPGGWSDDFTAPEGIVATIITHEHPDHFDQDNLRAIIAKNPDAIIIAHESITRQITDLPTKSVSADETIETGSFSLTFVGGQHAVISPYYPLAANLGVIIDQKLYYPGDSFFVPQVEFDILALPAAAPWCKISEVMEFAAQAKANTVFPTHDAILSDEGQQLVDAMLTPVIQDTGGEYRRLQEPLEV